ncbi:MAG: NUDIX hydrolase [Clostridia bacterium]|nr:NUDIX hydrolase [Clostridia bacterium]
MSFEEKAISSKSIYEGKVVHLSLDTVLLPDGSTSYREVVHHRGGAAVLYVREGKILLVRQFRYAYHKEIYEIVAGKVEAGEDPIVSATRELEEETGYRTTLTHLLDIYPTPGYTDEVIYIYLAEGGTQVSQKLDKGEFLSYAFYPVSEVLSMIQSGQITDSKTICAVYTYLRMKGE